MPKKVLQTQPKTIYEKIYDQHVVDSLEGGFDLLFIDAQLGHEVTSSQAFDELRKSKIQPSKKNLLFTEDHNIPTTKGRYKDIKNKHSKNQVDTLRKNMKDYGIKFFPMEDKRQGIVHVVGPEQGLPLPGRTLICGDSHTSTHGAFGCIAFGVGTSEVSMALQTEVLCVKKLKNMRVVINGKLKKYVTAKDVILYIISQISASGGSGYAIEFSGEVFDNMSMEQRMTVANMSIEADAKVGIFNVDQTTLDYIKGKPMAPKGKKWNEYEKYARTLVSDSDAHYDKEHVFNAADITPQVSWGTNAGETCSVNGEIPDNASEESLKYIGLSKGTKITDIQIDRVFIGSCTNGRIEDFRSAAQAVIDSGLKKHSSVKSVWVVPGSGIVKEQAEKEGLDKIFIEAGFEWREPGCSACLAMNDDKIPKGEHCASTSNRNFENRQGEGAITHLCSPYMAVLAAVNGHFVDPSRKKLSEKPKFPKKKDNMPIAYFMEENINTDVIIPQTCLSGTKKTGLGVHLFHNRRFTEFIDLDIQPGKEKEIKDFFLNQDEFRNAQVLIVGKNFGCGSSRQHAPWSFYDYGFRVIIAESFAKIFYGNSFNSGILLIELPKKDIDTLLSYYKKEKNYRLNVDLENQNISIAGIKFSFDIGARDKRKLLEGLDEAVLTLKESGDKIKAYKENTIRF